MVNLVEQLYRGTLDFSRVNFDFKHIEIRSKQRKISMAVIKNLIFNEKMLSYEFNPNNSKECELRYKAPNFLKGYGNIKIRVKVFDNCINVMTVIEDKLTASKSRRNKLKYPKISDEFELQEKLLRNARYCY